MGRYEPKERKNRGKVTKKNHRVDNGNCSLQNAWMVREFAQKGGHRRRVSRTRASRARIPCKLALFAFTTFTPEGTAARWVFLRLVIFQCSMRAFLRAFLGLFSPSWDEKQFRVLKNVRKKSFSRCGWGSCNEICEGCESKKSKIAVCTRMRAREKGVFGFIYRSLLAVVSGCCHTCMERGERVSRWSQIYLRRLAKNVGDFPENVGDFLKNVGVFFGKFGAKVQKVVRVAGAVEKAPKPV